MNEGLMLAIQPKRGANSGNNANADYKIFIMLSQSQDTLLHIPYFARQLQGGFFTGPAPKSVGDKFPTKKVRVELFDSLM